MKAKVAMTKYICYDLFEGNVYVLNDIKSWIQLLQATKTALTHLHHQKVVSKHELFSNIAKRAENK